MRTADGDIYSRIGYCEITFVLGGEFTEGSVTANEIAVEAFINHEIGFYDISNITAKVLEKDWSKLPVTYEEVLLFDSMARKYAKEQKC